MVPETCEPTWTVWTAWTVPVAPTTSWMSPRSTGTAAYLTSWSWLRNANTAATTATAAATRTMRDTRLRGITPSLDREARGMLAFPHVKGCEATARRRQGLWFEPVPVPVPVALVDPAAVEFVPPIVTREAAVLAKA